MTFQEALTVIYAPAGTHDNDTVSKAVNAVKWHENNVLELEDYETEQLFKVLKYINSNKLEGFK